MSFQAYLDNIKAKTGKSADDFIRLAKKKGLLDPGVKAGEIVDWLKKEYGLGHGHSMAIYAVFKSYLEGSAITVEDTFSKLAKPAQRALANAEITTLKQLSKLTEEELNSLHGIGKNAIVQLKDMLSKNMLSLAKAKK
jgi:hypothetical protein